MNPDRQNRRTAVLAFSRIHCNSGIGSLHEPNSYSPNSATNATTIWTGTLNGFKAHQNLAAVYIDAGDWEKAEIEWREVIASAPRYRPGWRGLGEHLVRRGKLQEALITAADMNREGFALESRLLEGTVAFAQGRLQDARVAWEDAMRSDPHDPEACRLLGRIHFEQQNETAAIDVLHELIRRDPADPSAHHNLGSVLLRTGRVGESISEFQESLRLRPRSAESLLCLGYAFQQAGRKKDAENTWKQVVELFPENAEARSALRSLL